MRERVIVRRAPHLRVPPYPRGAVVAAVVLAAATLALVWLVAVPWGPLVCAAESLLADDCGRSTRPGAGVVATVVVAVVTVVTVGAASIRSPHRETLALSGVLLLVLAPFVAYVVIAFSG